MLRANVFSAGGALIAAWLAVSGPTVGAQELPLLSYEEMRSVVKAAMAEGDVTGRSAAWIRRTSRGRSETFIQLGDHSQLDVAGMPGAAVLQLQYQLELLKRDLFTLPEGQRFMAETATQAETRLREYVSVVQRQRAATEAPPPAEPGGSSAGTGNDFFTLRSAQRIGARVLGRFARGVQSLDADPAADVRRVRVRWVDGLDTELGVAGHPDPHRQ